MHAFSPRLPELVAPLEPLAEQWDPLGDHYCYMLMLSGPVKVDLIFDEPHELEPPWRASAETLPLIDRHFWDWALWLASKQLAGQDEVVQRELDKMWRHLLRPVGIVAPPHSLQVAIDAYLRGRHGLEAALGVQVPPELEQEVLPALWRASR